MGFRQGKYIVKNKEKYLGTKDPRYMSSWELDVFKRLDENPNVLKWGSETVIVPYYSTIDGRKRRYMVDIYVEYLKNGEKITEIIEIKPFKETKPPKKVGRKKKETYLKELYTYSVNVQKWEAATKYAKERGWNFKIITEKDMYK